MLRGNFLNDGKPEAAALRRRGIFDPKKPLEHHLCMFFCNSDAIVFDLENCHSARCHYTAGDVTTFRGISQRVVQQILGQFLQQERIAADHRRSLCLEAEVNPLLKRDHDPVLDDPAHESHEIQWLMALLGRFPAFRPGQGQQLIDQAPGAVDADRNLPQGMSQCRRSAS